jgi:1-acyl-sn-glycerol-3-phosphate acyltransferase
MSHSALSSSSKKETSERSRFQRGCYWLLHQITFISFTLAFGLRRLHRERIPKTGGALVCSNHQSHLDPILVGVTCHRRLNYLARHDLFHAKWLAPIIRFLDAIPLERGGLVGMAGLKETMRRLKRGELVLIFPEGQRTHDGKIGKLKGGFGTLARKCNVPIVPVAIAGAFDSWPRTRPRPGLARIAVSIGEPLQPEDFAGLSEDELLALLHQRLEKLLAEANHFRGAR